MKKYLSFLFIVFWGIHSFAQSYEIKIYRCSTSLSDFQKILKDTPNDIVERFGSEIYSFKIEDKQNYSSNKMQKISDMLKPVPNMTEEQRESMQKHILILKNNEKSNIEVGFKISAYCKNNTDKTICIMLNFLYREFEGFFELGNLNSGNLYPHTNSANIDSITLLEMNKPFVLNTYFNSNYNNNILVNFFVLIASKL